MFMLFVKSGKQFRKLNGVGDAQAHAPDSSPFFGSESRAKAGANVCQTIRVLWEVEENRAILSVRFLVRTA